MADQEQIIENPRNESKIQVDECFAGKTSYFVVPKQLFLSRTNVQ